MVADVLQCLAVIVVGSFPSITFGVVVSDPDRKRDGREQWLGRFRKRDQLVVFLVLSGLLLDLDFGLSVVYKP
jgi:hypothetical protein